jgi:hypothetical protein
VTATETYPLSNEESRVDIEIVSPEFLIIVEVKVDAPEGEEQVSRYLTLASRKAAGRPFAVIFLSRHNSPVDLKKELHVIRTTWKGLAAAIREVAGASVSTESGFVDILLAQFAQHIKAL